MERRTLVSLDTDLLLPANSHVSHLGQSWVFIGKTDAKAETPLLWPPHVKS